MKQKVCVFVIFLSFFVFAGMVSTVHGDTLDTVSGEVFIRGTVSGTYTDTQISDDVYESLQENRQGNRTLADHRWIMNVTGGDTVTFGVEAYVVDAGDGEGFIFSYSTDGSTYTDMMEISNSSDTDTPVTYTLPNDTRGIVFINVRDSDQTTKNLKKEETLYVDYIYINSTGEPPEPDDNLLLNPGFEEGTDYWYGYDGVSLASTTEAIHSGTNALLVSNRTYDWQGPIHDLYNALAKGNSYSNSIWVKLKNAESAPFTLTIKSTIDGVDYYSHIYQTTVSGTDWVELSGLFTNDYEGTLNGQNMYIEGPPAGVEYYVDDAMVQGSGDWETEANERIEQIRKSNLHVVIVDEAGNPVTNAAVNITQTKHDFAFGAAMSYYVLDTPEYQQFFTNHFEWAVFENETKWSEIEPTAGARDYTRPDAMVQFCLDNGIRMRGHTIYWSVQTYIQEWVQDLAATPVQLYAAMSNHIETVVPRYSEHFEHWDVNNEMLHGTFYSNVFGNTVRTWMFDKTRSLDEDVTMFVNDYGVLSYSDTDKYVTQIQGLIDAGADIGGIGAQCHMWELNPYWMFNRLDKLGSLNLPVWCTEFDIANPDETIRARQLEIFYRSAFSHPAVQGILMWGFWASNHWRGADATIVNGDWTLNAAGVKYEELMDEWTTQTNGTPESTGVFSIRGFHGNYEVVVDVPGGTIITQQLQLLPESVDSTCVISISSPDTDGDGMPDIWEEQYSMNPAVPDDTVDSDGDGISNEQEFLALTDPDDPSSFPELSSACSAEGEVSISFPSSRARYYDLCFKSNLNNSTWTVMGSRMSGTDGTISITNTGSETTGYWNLKIIKPAD